MGRVPGGAALPRCRVRMVDDPGLAATGPEEGIATGREHARAGTRRQDPARRLGPAAGIEQVRVGARAEQADGLAVRPASAARVAEEAIAARAADEGGVREDLTAALSLPGAVGAGDDALWPVRVQGSRPVAIASTLPNPSWAE